MNSLIYEDEDFVVYDDVLPEAQFAELFSFLNGRDYSTVHADGRWHKVWRLHDGQPLTGRANWYLRSASEQPPTSEAVYPTDSPMDPLIEWTIGRASEVRHVVGRDDEWQALSFAPWIYPPGSGLSLHQDGLLYTGAFAFFAHPDWRLHWGGYLMILDRRTPGRRVGEPVHAFLSDDDETHRAFSPGIARAILPKPNRIVFLSPTAQHLISRVDANAGQASRVSVAGFFHKEAPAHLQPGG